jgi:hypothetical protein
MSLFTTGFPRSKWAIALIASLIFVGCFGRQLLHACPFCTAVTQTLSQQIETMDVVLIASADSPEASEDIQQREVSMKIEYVIKGKQFVEIEGTLTPLYSGKVFKGDRFLLTGAGTEEIQWSCVPITPRAEQYVKKLSEVDKRDEIDRLRFYLKYLDDKEKLLSQDAYDEFATAPYPTLKKMKDDFDHDQVLQWIHRSEMMPTRRRLHLMMLSVCGTEDDLPLIEEMFTSNRKTARSGLDAMVACYLMLSGEKGLATIRDHFLSNQSASYSETYAAVQALRFHGTEGGVIDRMAIAKSMHPILDRGNMADIVIPDLARWEDWSQIDKVKQLYFGSNQNNAWVRGSIVNYLQACPKPEAAVVLEELKKADPDALKRANMFPKMPMPTEKIKPSSSTELKSKM